MTLENFAHHLKRYDPDGNACQRVMEACWNTIMHNEESGIKRYDNSKNPLAYAWKVKWVGMFAFMPDNSNWTVNQNSVQFIEWLHSFESDKELARKVYIFCMQIRMDEHDSRRDCIAV